MPRLTNCRNCQQKVDKPYLNLYKNKCGHSFCDKCFKKNNIHCFQCMTSLNNCKRCKYPLNVTTNGVFNPHFCKKTFKITDKKEWLTFLETNGYVVIENVLSQTERKQFIQSFWREINLIIPNFNQQDKKTWKFPTGAYGLQRSYGLPQSDFAWLLRTNQSIQSLFAHIFKSNDLVVSTDSVKITYNKKPNSQLLDQKWLHRDQHPYNPLLSIQGIYSYYESGPLNCGTILVPESHLYTNIWEKKIKDNWCLIPKTEQDNYYIGINGNNQIIKPYIPENSMILFNSRTIHANIGDQINRGVPELNRLSLSIAFAERKTRNKQTLEMKKKLYSEQKCSAHWPGDQTRVIPPSQYEMRTRDGLQKLPLPPNNQTRLDLL